MKKALLVAVIGLGVSFGSAASLKDELKNQRLCKVTVCNKIERFSLNPFSHMKDAMGETCSVAILPAEEAEVGHVLSSDSRWYQGSSINPTKKSVTRVAEVHYCDEE
ncbi:hypothetical protein [Salmonella phage SE131]|uniref:Uncharacterized protein n=1 Tax=Salmonella phage SE131 TaxID=2081631 RepID=A0A2P1CAE0_9CAUD|nr:hypothetical protein PQC35_gp106 [Salmonella phage SE131]AVJ48193.1 hypothetical protein [Salmonella phage SE131]